MKENYVPKYYGACGRMIIVENAGQNLNYAKELNFFQRSFIAHEIVQGTIFLTENHPNYRIYLTDISPDNIAFDSKFVTKFVDLENVILTQKNNDSKYFNELIIRVCPESMSSSALALKWKIRRAT